MRRPLALLLPLLLACTGCASVVGQADRPIAGLVPEGAGDFRFAVMADNQPWNETEAATTGNPHFPRIIALANQRRPDFVVIAGDQILGYTDDLGAVRRQWDVFDRLRDSFNAPVVSVVGNHDVWDPPSERLWLERHGPLYFSWNHKGCHFVALDSERIGQRDHITADQLRWLEADLRKAAAADLVEVVVETVKELRPAQPARRIFLFLHKPLWAFPPEPGHDENAWNRDVHPLLAKYGVHAVFAGHWHGYGDYGTRDGVRYIITGGAGGRHSGYELAGGFYHFVQVDVAGDDTPLTVVTEHGDLPPDCVTDQSVRDLEDSLVVEPIRRLSPSRHAEIRIRVTNPTTRPATALLDWRAEDTAWITADARADVAPGDQQEIVARATLGDPLFPLPDARLELVDGDRKLFSWRFLSRALETIGPFVRHWNVAAPFDLEIRNLDAARKMARDKYLALVIPGWDGCLPPEESIDLDASYLRKHGRTVAWQPLEADARGIVDLDAAYGADYAAACAVAYIHSPRDAAFDFTVGSDDSVLVCINRRQVWRRHTLRGAQPDDDTFRADLKQGWNEVLLKVADREGGWGFVFRVLDPQGELKFALRPEP